MKIAKKELLERARAASVSHVAEMDFEKVVVRTARALGYEVLDEPELPERLRYAESSTGLLCRIETEDGIIKIQAHIGEAAFLRELVVRYGAKAEVLAIVNDLEGALSYRVSRDDGVETKANKAAALVAIRGIRAAYKEKP